jgi:hypothetical protein
MIQRQIEQVRSRALDARRTFSVFCSSLSASGMFKFLLSVAVVLTLLVGFLCVGPSGGPSVGQCAAQGMSLLGVNSNSSDSYCVTVWSNCVNTKIYWIKRNVPSGLALSACCVVALTSGTKPKSLQVMAIVRPQRRRRSLCPWFQSRSSLSARCRLRWFWNCWLGFSLSARVAAPVSAGVPLKG